MDILVGIPMISLLVSAVALVAINIESVNTIESILFVLYTGRNSGLTPQRLERDLVPLSIQKFLLSR